MVEPTSPLKSASEAAASAIAPEKRKQKSVDAPEKQKKYRTKTRFTPALQSNRSDQSRMKSGSDREVSRCTRTATYSMTDGTTNPIMLRGLDLSKLQNPEPVILPFREHAPTANQVFGGLVHGLTVDLLNPSCNFESAIQFLKDYICQLEGVNPNSGRSHSSDFLDIVKVGMEAHKIRAPDWLGKFQYENKPKFSCKIFSAEGVSSVREKQQLVVVVAALFHSCGDVEGQAKTGESLDDVLAEMEDGKTKNLLQWSLIFVAKYVMAGCGEDEFFDVAINASVNALVSNRSQCFPMFSFAYMAREHSVWKGSLERKFTHPEHKNLMRGHCYEFSCIFVRYLKKHEENALGAFKWKQCHLTKHEKKKGFEGIHRHWRK